MWDNIMFRSAVRAMNSQDSDRIMRQAELQYEENEQTELKEAATQAAAYLMAKEDTSTIAERLSTYSFEYQTDIQNDLLNLWSRLNREKGFDYLLQTEHTVDSELVPERKLLLL